MFEHIPPELKPILEELLYALVGVLGLYITRFFHEAGNRAKAEAKVVEASIPTERLSALKDFLTFAVKESEQLGVTKQILNESKVLRDHAIEKAQVFLDGLGWKIDASLVESVLESLILDGVHKGEASSLLQGEPLKPYGYAQGGFTGTGTSTNLKELQDKLASLGDPGQAIVNINVTNADPTTTSS